MLVESICIVLIIAVLIFIFLRGGRKEYAVLAAPLLVLPAMHTATNIINEVVFPNISLINMLIIADIIGLALAAVLFGILSVAKIKSKKARIAYLTTSGGFTLILGIIYLLNLIKYI